MEDAVITAIATTGSQLAVLAAKGTATQVSNRFQAIRQKKTHEELCNSYEELINELESYKDKFINAMEDDLNTADAVSAIFELSKFINTNVNETSSLEFAKMCLDKFNELTGVLNIVNKKNDDILDKDIEELIQKRADAKKNKDFKLADEIRQELLDKGIVLEDTRQGTKWKRV